VKRLLLTHDEVYVLGPREIEMFPPSGFSVACGMPAFGGSVEPVRPLGKVPDYDNEFDRFIDECSQLTREGLLHVVDYQPEPQPTLTIGNSAIGDYPLNVQLVLSFYRQLIRDETLLNSAVDGELLRIVSDPTTRDLFATAGQADININGIGPAQEITTPLIDDAIRSDVSKAARSRVGNIIKTIGYAEIKGLTPYFVGKGYCRSVSRIGENFRLLLDGEKDPLSIRRNSLINYTISEHFDEERLENMSISDVLSLRTIGFSKYGKARDSFFNAVDHLSDRAEDMSDERFEALFSGIILDFKRSSAELTEQRAKLGIRAVAEISKIGIGTAAIGTIGHMLSPAALIPTLAIGAAWAAKTVADNSSDVWDFAKSVRNERSSRRSSDFGLIDYPRFISSM
jgi:hypothetical protein